MLITIDLNQNYRWKFIKLPANNNNTKHTQAVSYY